MMKNYTIVVFSENEAGVLGMITSIFTARNINIETLLTEKSSVPDVHRLTIGVRTDNPRMFNLTKQIEKRVHILKASLYDTTDYLSNPLTEQDEKILLTQYIN